MKSNYKRIGNYIRLVDERNSGHNVKNLLGLSISKQFIPSVANLVGTDMENYKIIRKNQLACSTMQIRRDKKMPIALLQEVNEAIISSAYSVFEIINPEELLPEYLMMWFSRQEFDREACFHAIGGVRGSLEWEDFCDMKLAVPHPNKQSEITKEYNTIVNRININNQLIRKLEATAQSIYKQWFLDFEFPNEEGKPYKSSGGEMDESELGEIPRGWQVSELGEIAFLSIAKTSIETINISNYISTENMLQKRGGIVEASSIPILDRVTKFSINDVLVSNIRPYFKKIWLAKFDGGCSNDVLCFRARINYSPELLYYTLERDEFFDYVMAGSNGVKMPRGEKKWIMKFPIVKPEIKILEQFTKIQEPIIKLKQLKRKESVQLQELSKVLLSKLATIQN